MPLVTPSLVAMEGPTESWRPPLGPTTALSQPSTQLEVRLADTGPGYREFAPARRLAPFLRCLWVRDAHAFEAHSVVVPDGCMDLVWLGDQVMVAGPSTFPIAVDPPPGTTIVGVRFHPGVAPRVLGHDAGDFLDVHVPLDELWPREARQLKERGGAGESPAAKLDLLNSLVTSRLQNRDFYVDETLRHGVSLLGRQAPIGVRELASALYVSERHLLRLFLAGVGYGPKKLQRVLRFQCALGALRAPQQAGGLAEIALEAGYADQAHMTRDFIELSGLPPTKWLASSAGERLFHGVPQGQRPVQTGRV